jgi:transcriptional regulator NrdR family protein
MNCADCGSNKLAVYDTRHVGAHVVRKRKCVSCNEKFYTIESYMSEEELEEIEVIRKEEHDGNCKTGRTASQLTAGDA